MTEPQKADVVRLLPLARFELNRRRSESVCSAIFDLLDTVKDPEVPVLSIWDLGILQDVSLDAAGVVTVTITPTYSGCPAVQHIRDQIVHTLVDAGYTAHRVDVSLQPTWTTDWLEPETRQRLRNYGIAAPDSTSCPQCGSSNTSVISEFGATACKALLRCNDCSEPFDHFKPI